MYYFTNKGFLNIIMHFVNQLNRRLAAHALTFEKLKLSNCFRQNPYILCD